ncbi:MAG: hypothetical protein ACLGSD_09565 [Acidobacteriota bacterium]
MSRLSLYLIGVYGLIAAGMVYVNRRNEAQRNSVVAMADRLREAWADHHTVA